MGGFTNAVVGGAETLIRSAIRSANYVAGLLGWRISKDGEAEFNDITARGTILANNGNIVIDSNGIVVTSPAHQWIINSSSGFISKRVPDDGTLGQIFDAGFFMRPITPSPINGANIDSNGKIYADTLTIGGTDEAPYVDIVSPTYQGRPAFARVLLLAQSYASTVDDTEVRIVGNKIKHNGFTQGIGLFGYGYAASNFSMNTTVETVLMATAFSYTFTAGYIYEVSMHAGQGSVGTAPNRVISRLRKGNTTAGTQLDAGAHQFANTGGGDGSWTSLFAVGASDVTTQLCWTLATGSPAFQVNWNTPLYMTIKQVGLQTDTGMGVALPTLT